MIRRVAGVAAIVMLGWIAGHAGARAEDAARDVQSLGRAVSEIGESMGLREKVPPAPAFVVKTRPPEQELDYRPLDPTEAESPQDAYAAARAAGQELDAAGAVNRRLATGVAPPPARPAATRPKKGMDPFDSADNPATN